MAVNPTLHSIVPIVVWFGPWPFWLPVFLRSCRHNADVEWLIFGDATPPASPPANVKFLHLELDAFNRRSSAALGFDIRLRPDFAYKLCDLKAMYGEIFESELRGVDFWGFCDLDIVWGDIRKFATPELLGRYDIVTSRPGRISGHFCLFRNRPEWNGLYRRIPGVEEHLGQVRRYAGIDEGGLTELLSGDTKHPLRRLWRRHVRRQAVPRVYWRKTLTTNGPHQRLMLADPALSMRWRDGRTYDALGRETMYRRRSLAELQRVIELTRRLKPLFARATRPLVIATLGGFSVDTFLSEAEVRRRYAILGESLKELDTDGVELVAQTLAPFPWYFGGQMHLNLFVRAEDTVAFCRANGLRLCLDISHSRLACNHCRDSFGRFIDLVGPHTAHLHLADAQGIDGEGLQVGAGEIDFPALCGQLRAVCPGASFIPEIWLGHTNQGEGFWTALERLETLGF